MNVRRTLRAAMQHAMGTLIFSVILLSSAACASRALVPGGDPRALPRILEEVRGAHDLGAHQTVLKWVDSTSREGLGPSTEARLLQVKALSLIALKRSPEAIEVLDEALSICDEDLALTAELGHHRALATLESGRVSEAVIEFEKVEASRLPANLGVNHRILLARIQLKKERWAQAALELLDTAKEVPQAAPALAPLLEEALASIESAVDLRALLQKQPESPLADRLMFRLAMLELQDGDSTEAKSVLRRLLARFPTSPVYAEASRLLQEPLAHEPAPGLRIGVLVPRSGKFAELGRRALESIRLAVASVPRMRRRLGVVAVDSGESPESLVQAFEKLVREHQVLAVLGPIRSRGMESLSRRAEELGVPVVSLASREAPPSDYLIEGGVTLMYQIEQLVRLAMQKRGRRRFAILYPQDSFGQAAADLFWESVERQGGEITAVTSFRPGEPDFRTSVDRLSGRGYPEARRRELRALAARRKALKVRTRNRKTEALFDLPPVVAFDAVFLPDGLGTVQQVLPMFAYRDILNVDFLGPSIWNSPDGLRRLPSPGPGQSLWFVDLFSEPGAANDVGGRASRFVEQYRALGLGAPGASDATAYDAASLLVDAIQRSHGSEPVGSGSRLRLLRSILDTRRFPGVTGSIDVLAGALVRPVRLHTVRDGRVVLAE